MTKNVLITGGSRGIGLGIAKELAALGCNLAVNGVRPEAEVTKTLDMLKQFGTNVIYCQGDVSSATDRAKIVQCVLNEFEVVNVLVNNAGVAPKTRTDLLEVSEESYERLMNINLKGSFFLTQIVANHMVMQRNNNLDFNGSIVNISSVSAIMASPNRGEYCISKAGMSMMTKLFAVKLGEHGIPVYEVRPGVIETDMTAAVLEKYQKQAAEGLTIEPRLGLPKDVGKAVAALIENRIPYATGQVITIDGGLSLSRF
jgi:NAD(P)-dependent dehydrogenase (short-subunit alcohol dehydrogenase family)